MNIEQIKQYDYSMVVHLGMRSMVLLMVFQYSILRVGIARASKVNGLKGQPSGRTSGSLCLTVQDFDCPRSSPIGAWSTGQMMSSNWAMLWRLTHIPYLDCREGPTRSGDNVQNSRAHKQGRGHQRNCPIRDAGPVSGYVAPCPANLLHGKAFVCCQSDFAQTDGWIL